MKKRNFLMGLVLFVNLAILNCEKNPTNVYKVISADGRVIGMVQGVVQDSYSGVGLANIVVKYIIKGEV